METTVSLKELRRLASSLPAPAFTAQLGPFVLVQRAPGDARADTGLLRTQAVAAWNMQLSMATLLLGELDELLVATLPPLRGEDRLEVGRLPACELVLDHPSVSKRHAVVRWNAADGRCTVQDLGSTNGTLVNGMLITTREVPLRDGDLLAFGDVAFWFLLSGSLHARLQQEQGREGEPSR